jgi:nitroreductase
MIADLVRKNRSCRRFYQQEAVSLDTLRELVDLARLSASGANRQPLKYILSCEPGRNARVFAQLAWAAYLKDWGGPVEGERPAAYIVILGDKEIANSFGVDHGISAQSMLLGATEKGLGGLWHSVTYGKKRYRSRRWRHRTNSTVSPVITIPSR